MTPFAELKWRTMVLFISWGCNSGSRLRTLFKGLRHQTNTFFIYTKMQNAASCLSRGLKMKPSHWFHISFRYEASQFSWLLRKSRGKKISGQAASTWSCLRWLRCRRQSAGTQSIHIAVFTYNLYLILKVKCSSRLFGGSSVNIWLHK